MIVRRKKFKACGMTIKAHGIPKDVTVMVWLYPKSVSDQKIIVTVPAERTLK